MADRRFDLVLEQQRPLILAAALLGALAAITNILVIQTVPGATSVDVITQVGVCIAMVMLCAMLLVDTHTPARRLAGGAALIVMIGLGGRWLYSLFGHGLAVDPDDTIAPVMSWMPFGFVMAFVFLECRHAIQVSLALLVATIVPTLVHAWLFRDHVFASPRITEMLFQHTLAHPILLLFLITIARTHRDFRAIQGRGEDVDIEQALSRRADPLTLLPNRTVFREDLNQAVTAGRDRGVEVVVGLLQIDGLDPGESELENGGVDARVQQVAHTLRGELGNGARIARLSDTRFGMIWLDTPLVEALGVCRQALNTLNLELAGSAEPPPVSRAGLAAYQPGESVQNLLARCDQRLRAGAQDPHLVGYEEIEL